MIATTDLVGLGALISATCAGIVSIIVAVRQGQISTKVEETHAAVSTANGHTLGELVEGQEARSIARGEAPTK